MNPGSMALRGRLALAVASGLLLIPAFPPFDQGWVAFVALAPLCLALRGASARAGALTALLFGAVFFGVHIYWIWYFGFAAWTALVLLESVTVAVFGAFAARASALGAAGRLAGVPILWAGVEMLRGRFPLGGFTWGLLANSQISFGPALPLARVGGAFALGLAIMVVNALLAEAVTAGPARRRASLALGGAALALLPGLLPMGLAGAASGTLDVAAIQGNVPRERFTALGRSGRTGPEDEVIVENHIRLSDRLVGDAPDLVVWPENSFDRDPRVNPALFEPVADLVRRVGASFVIGAILDDGDKFLNSNLLVAPDGTIVDRYDKLHLVPFGEYVPFAFARTLVPALDRELPVDGRPGDRPVLFDAGAARIGTVICFESTYPELMRDVARLGAEVLMVTTNNASFGTSPAARQHLAASRLRAVENGRAVVHAAISGISAIIAPDGRVIARAGLFEQAVLRARVPRTNGRTPYTRYGAGIEIALGIAALGAAAAPWLARRGGGGEERS